MLSKERGTKSQNKHRQYLQYVRKYKHWETTLTDQDCGHGDIKRLVYKFRFVITVAWLGTGLSRDKVFPSYHFSSYFQVWCLFPAMTLQLVTGQQHKRLRVVNTAKRTKESSVLSR